MCAVLLDNREKLLMTPTGQFASFTGGRSQSGHCVRRAVGKCQRDRNQRADGPALVCSSKAWPCFTPTACVQDSIDKKPSLALQGHLNKAQGFRHVGTQPYINLAPTLWLFKALWSTANYSTCLGLRQPEDISDFITWRGESTPLRTAQYGS